MWNWVDKVQELKSDGKIFAIVTLVEHSGSSPREPGAKMLVTSDAFWGSVGGGRLEWVVLEEARRVLHSGESKKIRIPLGAKTGQCCGGIVEVFIEVVGSLAEVTIFGAGHVAQALSKVLLGTPFRVHLVDERKEWIQIKPCPENVVCHEMSWEDYIESEIKESKNSYFLIMTHDHQQDLAILEKLIQKEFKYLGLIGSESKKTRFINLLTDKFKSIGKDPDLLKKIHCPIGKKTGKSPQEVSISIAAELLDAYHNG